MLVHRFGMTMRGLLVARARCRFFAHVFRRTRRTTRCIVTKLLLALALTLALLTVPPLTLLGGALRSLCTSLALDLRGRDRGTSGCETFNVSHVHTRKRGRALWGGLEMGKCAKDRRQEGTLMGVRYPCVQNHLGVRRT